MKIGIVSFLLTCCLILLSGCDNSPQAQQQRALKNQARNELFMKCVEVATRPGINPYRDNGDIIHECRISSQQLI